MKVSALGVEEQRVNVICDLVDPPQTLGDQYRVDVRVVLWTGTATKAPAIALFTAAGAWQVFAVRDGRARVQTVTPDHLGETEIEIARGLNPGDTIIAHPSDQVRDGIRVKPRR
jgi:HlyD family secretion protein